MSGTTRKHWVDVTCTMLLLYYLERRLMVIFGILALIRPLQLPETNKQMIYTKIYEGKATRTRTWPRKFKEVRRYRLV